MKILAASLLLLVGLMGWQHLRYLNARRQLVQDRQPLLYPSSTFHVMTFLEIDRDEELIAKTTALRGEIEAAGGQLIYAGQAAFTRSSTQLGERDWDAVLLTQYPSPDAYEAALRSEGVHKALAAFKAAYAHGMKRPQLTNLMIPQLLLGLRCVDVLQGNWSVEELTPIPTPEGTEQSARLESIVASLRRLRSVNDEALVVFNLITPGNAEQQKANRSYGLTMVKRMAALVHGPMHAGQAVTIEGDARFEQAVIVYYPGPDYFAELLRSRFFQDIIGDKQLGDTQAVPTVPILSLLEPRA